MSRVHTKQKAIGHIELLRIRTFFQFNLSYSQFHTPSSPNPNTTLNKKTHQQGKTFSFLFLSFEKVKRKKSLSRWIEKFKKKIGHQQWLVVAAHVSYALFFCNSITTATSSTTPPPQQQHEYINVTRNVRNYLLNCGSQHRFSFNGTIKMVRLFMQVWNMIVIVRFIVG